MFDKVETAAIRHFYIKQYKIRFIFVDGRNTGLYIFSYFNDSNIRAIRFNGFRNKFPNQCIIVNDNDKAVEVLKEKGFTVSKTEVVAVEVPDRPGGLANVLALLEKEGINVEYMYAFIERSSDNAVIVFRFDENDSAIKVLTSNGVTILEGVKVYSL